MTTENKTSEDLQNDAVNFVYVLFKYFKYGFIIGVICIIVAIVMLSTVGN
jgi:hypothetical protein